MDESVIKHLEQPHQVGTLKLSDVILNGCTMSRPTSDINVEAWVTTQSGQCYACIFGAAYLGDGGGADDYKFGLDNWASEKFGVPQSICREAHMRYESDGHSRENVAGWLKAQGY